MAMYFGESGCWRNILLELKKVGIIPSSLFEIRETLHIFKKQYIEEQAKAEIEFNQQRLLSINLIETYQNSSQQQIEQKSLEVSQQIEWLDQKIKSNELFIFEKTKWVEDNLNLQLNPFLIPLNEICSNYLHPLLNKTIFNLLSNCEDGSEVKLFKSAR